MNVIAEIHKKLIPYAGILGNCELLRAQLRKQTELLCDETWETSGGDLVCHIKEPGKKRIMLWADMHSEGFYVIGQDTAGYAYLQSCDVDAKACQNTLLHTAGGEIAVLRYNERKKGNDVSKPICFADRGENTTELPVGTQLVYKAEMRVLQDGKAIMAPFSGSLLACAALIHTLGHLKRSKIGADLYIVFADGSKNAAMAASEICPDIALCCTAASAEDGNTGLSERIVRINGGPVLKLRDQFAACNKQLARTMEKIAFCETINLQLDASPKGSAGYRELQFRCGGIPSVALAVPMRYIGSPTCVYGVEDAEKLCTLLRAFCEKGASEDD